MIKVKPSFCSVLGKSSVFKMFFVQWTEEASVFNFLGLKRGLAGRCRVESCRCLFKDFSTNALLTLPLSVLNTLQSSTDENDILFPGFSANAFQHGGSLYSFMYIRIRFVLKIIYHFLSIRSISTLIIGNKNGRKRPRYCRGTGKGRFYKASNSYRKENFGRLHFHELHLSKLEVEIIPLSFTHCKGKPG